MPDDHNKTYDVGFGKPPKPSQFRKGFSGNPKGRPKGRRNLATILNRTLQEKVVTNENGVRRTVTKYEATMKQLVNQAASGDLRAVRQLLALVGSVEEERATPPKRELDQNDQKVMENVLKRFKKSANGEANENQ
jgi:replication-associated recombination protein RarA